MAHRCITIKNTKTNIKYAYKYKSLQCFIKKSKLNNPI